MARMFGTSGVRGVTNKEITPELALRIGTIFGNLLNGDCDVPLMTVAVGHDNRYGAEMLARAAATGLTSAGADVDFLGCVTTGVFSTFMGPKGNNGGVLITGSHMPPERIGIIPCWPNGHYHDRDMTDRIEAALRAWPENVRFVEPDRVGSVAVISPEDSVGVYSDTILSHIDGQCIRDCAFRVFFDPANGTSGEVVMHLLDSLNCAVQSTNFMQKPIPDRPSECRAETCGEAIRLTAECACDIGVCFDGDADRVLFITGEGKALPDSVVGAIFIRHLLGEGQTIVTPVNASGLVQVMAQEHGAQVLYCRIGQPSTDTMVRQHRAAFAYEEAAGKFGFAELECCYDGPFAVLKMLEIMAKTDKSLAELAAEIPLFFQKAAKISVPDAKKEAVVADAVDHLRNRLDGQITREDTTDGTKFFLNDGSWVLIRPSGTEPVVRVYADTGVNQKRVDELVALGATCFAEAIATVG